MPEHERAATLSKLKMEGGLIDGMGYPDQHRRELCAKLALACEKEEQRLAQLEQPHFPAPTWAETAAFATWLARPVFIAATIGGIGYSIVAALIGVGQGVMAWASANGGLIVAVVLGVAAVYGLWGNMSWGRGEDGETTKETFTETEYFRHTEYTKETK